ncbi:Fungal specific transcription factor [Coniochaeta hoffmannii]|uniref:Fungal specific transcription factor n=1 Tax=Coniochaeta hoffmannii TaxID=91930 RepID=A0AA38S1K3_9PEZI|nr:Fungal specific transcription factor [Coniochaeta hoffmannii]
MDITAESTAAERETPPAGSPPVVPFPRACENCRARKIKCNRGSPCSHCLLAKIPCIHAEFRPKEKRTRVLITPQYERKIDQFDRKLEAVLKTVEDIKKQLPTPTLQLPNGASPGSRIVSSIVSAPTPPSQIPQGQTSGTLVEGDSSLTAHSVFAKDLLGKFVSNESSPQLRETMDALYDIVDAMKKQPAAREMTYPHARTPDSSGQGHQLPPISKSVHVLNLAKSRKYRGLALAYDCLPMLQFSETCLSVYFSTDYSEADFIIVNMGLRYLFWTYSHEAPPEEREELEEFSRLCSANLETALSALPLHVPATTDMITALILGAYYTMELSKPSLSWILLSKASELCQTLGYHRIGSFKNDTPEDSRYKQFLFWVVYLLDKGLSLRLGRASTIQDYEITVPYPSREGLHSATKSSQCVSAFIRLWIMISQVQGQIYERLYCPEAITQSESVRLSRAQALAERLEEIGQAQGREMEKMNAITRDNFGDELTDFCIVSDEVLRLSLLTLVYRAVPHPAGSPTTFRAECIDAARATLAKHQECMAVIEKGSIGLFSTYMHWTILFAPFVSFIVLFCQVVETKDRADLARLQAFVSSLHSDDLNVSEAVSRLARLFQVLYTIALHHVETRTGNGQQVDQQQSHQTTTIEVDAYLAALGFPHQVMGEVHKHKQSQQQQQQDETGDGCLGGGGGMGDGFGMYETQRAVNPVLWMGNGAQLEEWLYTNDQMIGLLEDGSGIQ